MQVNAMALPRDDYMLSASLGLDLIRCRQKRARHDTAPYYTAMQQG